LAPGGGGVVLWEVEDGTGRASALQEGLSLNESRDARDAFSSAMALRTTSSIGVRPLQGVSKTILCGENGVEGE